MGWSSFIAAGEGGKLEARRLDREEATLIQHKAKPWGDNALALLKPSTDDRFLSSRKMNERMKLRVKF